MKKLASRIILFLLVSLLTALQSVDAQDKTPPFLNARSLLYADSVINTLSRREKIGQLFMVAAWSGTEKANQAEVDSLIKNYKIGGLIFFQGGPVRQANLYNYFQRQSKIPLLIGFDGEWGLSMRLDSAWNAG